MPSIYAVMGIFAAISAACCYAVYGEALYQPYEIVAKWDTSPGGRAAMFLASLIWALSNVTTNMWVSLWFLGGWENQCEAGIAERVRVGIDDCLVPGWIRALIRKRLG